MTSYAVDWLAKDMTLRDYFAAQAIGGILADPISQGGDPANLAKAAYYVAEAMMAEHAKHVVTFTEDVLK